MVQSDSQAQLAHLLLVVVQDHEVPIDAIVLRDQMQERHSHVAKSDEFLPFQLLIERVKADSVIQSRRLMLRIVDVVSDLEDGSLGLQVVKDLGVHLDL